jgi:hypothetical protein
MAWRRCSWCERNVPQWFLWIYACPAWIDWKHHVIWRRWMSHTAYSEHALEASDAHAVSYLVKPIRQERLEQALNKARKLTQAQLAALSMESGPEGRSHICAHIRGNLELISIDDVISFRPIKNTAPCDIVTAKC